MKNNFKKIFFLVILSFYIFSYSNSNEVFNFDVTEIEITENGNKFVGLKKGRITTNDGIIIDANSFEYDKKLNILKAAGNIKIEDTINNYVILTENLTYLKNQEIISTQKNSKAFDNEGMEIYADEFEFNKILNILNAHGNVEIKDNINDYIIYANDITYLRNKEKIFTQGDTKAIIESKYNFDSENVVLLRNEMVLSSSKDTKIRDDNNQFYNLSKFKYLINEEDLIGENILVITNYNLPKSDKFYFANGNFNLKSKKFIAKDTKIKIHKNIFDYNENDPRLYGSSSSGDENITIINNGIFTSCKKTDTCPPWSISSKKIIHDKKEKKLVYDNSILRLYDIPVFYFPKFFHPDPTVERQSGFLRPQLNNSDQLGTSINTPYFYVISKNKDLTFKPTFFDDNKFTLSNEYRTRGKNSDLDFDFSITRNYKSASENKKKNFSHLFSKFNFDLGWEKYEVSSISAKAERVNNNTYLKLFDSVLLDTPLKPKDFNRLENNITLNLDTDVSNFETGINIYENLQEKNNNRYQYNLPYYNFYSEYFPKNIKHGFFSFASNGSNSLINTNNLKTKIVNNLDFKSYNKITDFGFVNKYGVYLKNLSTVAKNDPQYKSSPQSQIMGLLNLETKLPLIKNMEKFKNTLTPKLSLRVNPSNTDNFSETDRILNVYNMFDINRLGLDEALEPGRSLTLGVDYKRQYNEHDAKFIQLNLATMFRDKEEHHVPKSSSLNTKSSNLFGSINISNPWDVEYFTKTNTFKKDLFEIKYDFSLNNDFNTFDHNSIDFTLDVNNFVTNFTFIENNGEFGDTNTIESTASYEFADRNFVRFNTRRNRKINLTEYYDLIYEYQNDCLTAGIKYKKTYYQDGDIQPKEDLMLTLTIIPLTTYEQEIDQDLYRN